ncbi:hypothetical protein GGR51DRAFT_524126 [Nemania sp. FL0031]|nr:hypothetical protein GGR51DRAFT_524126 [Nemania sp. FL0031]
MMDHLAEQALQFVNRLTHCTCHFVLDTQCRPYSGGECTIFVFETDGGKRIGVRMEQNISAATHLKVETEVQFLEAVKREKIDHLPYLIGYDLDSVPPLIATGWADGRELQWTDSTPPPQIRHNILRTVAEATLDMLRVNTSGGSALKWVTDKIYRTRTKRALSGHLLEISVDDCLELQRDVSRFHLPEFDDAPHVLVHGDLQPSNIIVNGEGVACIIDMGTATMVPLQFSAVYPRFLTSEPRQIEGVFDWSCCNHSKAQKADRAFFLQCITDMAPRKGEQACRYAEILALDDHEDRQWWLNAVSREDIMRALKTKPYPPQTRI